MEPVQIALAYINSTQKPGSLRGCRYRFLNLLTKNTPKFNEFWQALLRNKR
jgi:hypothetical protein